MLMRIKMKGAEMMKRKYFRLSLIVMLLLTLLIACSSNQEAGSSKKDNGDKEQIEIVLNNASRNYPKGMDANNNPYIEYIRDNTELDIKVTTPSSDGYNEKLNVMMASGDLPDMIYTTDPSWVVNYVNQNGLQPLDDAIEKYGEDLKKNIPDEAWEHVTIDGKIYAIPSVNTYPGTMIMYVRKDWLDTLNLEPPKTLDEYTEVMRAFKEEDPDGNGKDDTLGLVIAENLARTEPFFGAFGIQRNQWIERDGDLVYSSILPETKETLEYLSTLYQDGMLDKEFALNKTENFEEKIASGKAGLFAATWYDTRGPILTNEQNDPEAEWISLDFPIGQNGESGTDGTAPVRVYNVVPVTSKQADSVVKMLNFMIGEGYETLKFGFEDDVYTMEDGKMVTDFEKHNNHLYRLTLAETIEPDNLDLVKLRLDSLGEEFHLYDNLQKIKENAIYDEFLGTPTESMGKFNAKLNKLEAEVFTKIVMGEAPLDKFDQFVDEWKKEGGDQITKEVNDWYSNK
ncbi:lipoprotein LipO [Bacillus sp. J14TS2]|nr:lipoprotein LipO [Bacillus sp. J14TS2]